MVSKKPNPTSNGFCPACVMILYDDIYDDINFLLNVGLVIFPGALAVD